MFPITLAAMSPNSLLLLALVSIIGLVLLIAKFRLNAIIALTLVSLLLGLAAGMDPLKVADAFREGTATTLGSLAMIIGLGTILGKMLAESGGAHVVAGGIAQRFGTKSLDYAMMIAAFIVGVSVFFQVGLLLLGPIVFALARETKTPILRLGLPLAAGLSTAHGLIPPHPGPLAAINILGANVGKTIAWSLLVVGPPVALITGPFLARWVTPRVPVEFGGLGASATTKPSAPHAPGFGLSMFTILLPVLLMLVSTAADMTMPSPAEAQTLAVTYQAQQAPTTTDAATSPSASSPSSSSAPAVPQPRITEDQVQRAQRLAPIRTWADFVGNPTVAMLIAVLVSFYTFGRHCGLQAKSITKFAEDSLAPAAGVLLVIAAGGGFSKVLNASGVGDALATVGSSMHMSPLLLGWLIAGMMRVAVGSATVSVTTAAGIMLPIVQHDPTINKELLVLAMGAGSLILSHVNDGGFWLVKEYFGMDIPQTLKTWTVVETGIACVSIVIILIAGAIV
jgi:GntP family gluconate:H+ symporter